MLRSISLIICYFLHFQTSNGQLKTLDEEHRISLHDVASDIIPTSFQDDTKTRHYDVNSNGKVGGDNLKSAEILHQYHQRKLERRAARRKLASKGKDNSDEFVFKLPPGFPLEAYCEDMFRNIVNLDEDARHCKAKNPSEDLEIITPPELPLEHNNKKPATTRNFGSDDYEIILPPEFPLEQYLKDLGITRHFDDKTKSQGNKGEDVEHNMNSDKYTRHSEAKESYDNFEITIPPGFPLEEYYENIRLAAIFDDKTKGLAEKVEADLPLVGQSDQDRNITTSDMMLGMFPSLKNHKNRSAKADEGSEVMKFVGRNNMGSSNETALYSDPSAVPSIKPSSNTSVFADVCVVHKIMPES